MLSCILDPGNPCRGDESLRINMTDHRRGHGAFRGVPGARVQDVMVSLSIIHKKSLVITGSQDAFVFTQLEGRKHPGRAEPADTDAPGPLATASDGAQIAASIDQGVCDPESRRCAMARSTA